MEGYAAIPKGRGNKEQGNTIGGEPCRRPRFASALSPFSGFFGGRASVMGIENDHDENHLFKYVCPKCGCNWKEKIHTNDHPDDPGNILTGSPF